MKQDNGSVTWTGLDKGLISSCIGFLTETTDISHWEIALTSQSVGDIPPYSSCP